jgi:hypothetical protein
MYDYDRVLTLLQVVHKSIGVSAATKIARAAEEELRMMEPEEFNYKNPEESVKVEEENNDDGDDENE